MVGWLVDERGIEPHVNLIDKAERTDGTFSRSDFTFDPENNLYVCPGGKELKKYHRAFAKPRDGVTKEGTMIYFARKHDCEACALKPKCCPNVPARKIARSVHEAPRDKARAIGKTETYAVSRRERKKVEMLFAHLKRILRLDRLRLRGPSGAKDEFLLAATAQNLRKLAKLIPLPARSSPHKAERQESASLTAAQIPGAGVTTGVLQQNLRIAVVRRLGFEPPQSVRGVIEVSIVRPVWRSRATPLNGDDGRSLASPIVEKSPPDAAVKELVRCYTSVPSARASASSTLTPR